MHNAPIRVAQYDTDTGQIDFQYPTKYWANADDKFVSIKTGKQIDLLVTPDHDCLLRNRRR